MRYHTKKYLHLSSDQQSTQYVSLSIRNWDGKTDTLLQVLTTENPNLQFTSDNLLFRQIAVNQFEVELVAYCFMSDFYEANQNALFIGDGFQFLNQHLEWGEVQKLNSFSILHGRNQTVFINSQYVGTFSREYETGFNNQECFSLKLNEDSSPEDPILSLSKEWYDSGLPPEDLPTWLIQNSDIYAKDVINILPKEIQKRNRLIAQLKKHQKLVIATISMFLLSLVLLFAGLKIIAHRIDGFAVSQKNLDEAQHVLKQAKQMNERLNNRLQSFESNVSHRSNHAEMVSRYERLLPKQVFLKQLSISATHTDGGIDHQIEASSDESDHIYQLLGRLNALDEIVEVSLEKTIQRENGTIHFDLHVKYKTI